MFIPFLYMIASVSTAYVGFTSLFIAVRTSGGSMIDDYASWSVRYLIAVALTTIGTALLPAVLLAFTKDETAAAQDASFIAMLLLGRLDAIYAYRRRDVDMSPFDWRLTCLLVIAVVIDIGFGIVALRIMPETAPGTYMALELNEMIVMFCYFAWTLERMLPLRWEHGFSWRQIGVPSAQARPIDVRQNRSRHETFASAENRPRT
jgi:hypothetical protein